MQVSLPANNNAATLAQDMVPPSNWNPDRRNSVGKAPTSPSLNRSGKTPSSPSSSMKDSQPELTPTQEGEGEAERGRDPSSKLSSLSSASDDLLTKTIEEIGIDTTKFSVTEGKDPASASPHNKRQSVEIPVKKAKCSPASPDTEKQDISMKEEQCEMPFTFMPNGGSGTGDGSVTTDVVLDSATDAPGSVDASVCSEAQSINQPSV